LYLLLGWKDDESKPVVATKQRDPLLAWTAGQYLERLVREIQASSFHITVQGAPRSNTWHNLWPNSKTYSEFTRVFLTNKAQQERCTVSTVHPSDIKRLEGMQVFLEQAKNENLLVALQKKIKIQDDNLVQREKWVSACDRLGSILRHPHSLADAIVEEATKGSKGSDDFDKALTNFKTEWERSVRISVASLDGNSDKLISTRTCQVDQRPGDIRRTELHGSLYLCVLVPKLQGTWDAHLSRSSTCH
jgi:hypothetical protein